MKATYLRDIVLLHSKQQQHNNNNNIVLPVRYRTSRASTSTRTRSTSRSARRKYFRSDIRQLISRPLMRKSLWNGEMTRFQLWYCSPNRIPEKGLLGELLGSLFDELLEGLLSEQYHRSWAYSALNKTILWERERMQSLTSGSPHAFLTLL